MKEIIEAIFGIYNPVTYTVTQVLEDGSEIVNEIVPAGLAGCDWPYILGVFGFLLCLYCLLRIVGGVISKC